MKLETAQKYAEQLVTELSPHCDRIAIAGSVRRKKPSPSDIELVAIPRFVKVADGLFDSEPVLQNDLDVVMMSLVCSGMLQHGDPVTMVRDDKEVLSRAPFSEKYYRVKFMGEQVDVFAVLSPAQWGPIFTIRTGDAGYTHWLVSQGWPKGIYFRNGALVQHVDSKGRYISEGRWTNLQHVRCDLKDCGFITLQTPEEADVFKALGLEYIKPENRVTTHSEAVEWEEQVL